MTHAISAQVLVSGSPAHGRLVQRSDSLGGDCVFLTPTLNPTTFPFVSQCSAVICENGGALNHLAVLCRLSGIPVLLMDNAIAQLSCLTHVTVDAVKGVIHPGVVDLPDLEPMPRTLIGKCRNRGFQVSVVTPLQAKTAAHCSVLKVVQIFLRHEFLWITTPANPFDYCRNHGIDETANHVAGILRPFLEAIPPDCILNFRSLDLRSDEFRELRNDDIFEPNPQIGLHGIRHLLGERSLLLSEIRAVDVLRAEGYANIVFSVPFVTNLSEIEELALLVRQQCRHSIDLGVFIEIPSAIDIIDKLPGNNVTNLYVGSKDLAALLLGCDRGSKFVRHIFEANHPSFIKACERIHSCSHSSGMNVFLFTFLDDLPSTLNLLPQYQRLSLCFAEFQRLAGTPPPYRSPKR